MWCRTQQFLLSFFLSFFLSYPLFLYPSLLPFFLLLLLPSQLSCVPSLNCFSTALSCLSRSLFCSSVQARKPNVSLNSRHYFFLHRGSTVNTESFPSKMYFEVTVLLQHRCYHCRLHCHDLWSSPSQ